MNEYVKNLNRLEFVVTMSCTGRCKHCSEGSHLDCTGYIDADKAAEAIRKVCEKYQIKSLMTFGGEPLIYPEVVCAIHAAGTEMGIPQRDLITNGFFSKDKKRIEEVVCSLEKSGVRRILLSVDAFHQETIPTEPVKYFAECVTKTGIFIELCPAWLVSKQDSNLYNVRTREIIAEFSGMDIPVGKGNVIFPSGNALIYLKEYFEEGKQYINPYEDDPADIRAISFEPDGVVLNGNCYEKDILQILDEYRP